MGAIEMLMGLAESKAGTIAKVAGRPESQVRAALKRGRQMLPEIMKNANSPEGGAKILDNLGVDKNFIDEAYNRYSKYLSKIPGMNAINTKAVIDKLTGAMHGSSVEQRQVQDAPASKPMFDKSKYPKL